MERTEAQKEIKRMRGIHLHTLPRNTEGWNMQKAARRPYSRPRGKLQQIHRLLCRTRTRPGGGGTRDLKLFLPQSVLRDSDIVALCND